jgi:gamma-glutamylputrescine oxidase
LQRSVQGSPTWYEATSERGEGWPSLVSSLQCDCCVVGGGFAGLTTALELARKGLSVVLLEADQICGAASGRNGGIVSNGFALNAVSLAGLVGKDAARALYSLSQLGTEFVRETISTHDPSLKMGDGLRVCVRYADSGQLKAYGESLQREFGESVEINDTQETRRHLRTERYFDSLYFPKAFHIHPLRYGLQLAGLATKVGAQIFEHSRVERIERHQGAWRVTSWQGKVDAKHVVICVSAFDRGLHAWSGSAVLPVATHVAVTAPLKQDVIKTFSAVADTRRAGDYYRLIADGRILWGGRITTLLAEPRALADLMQVDMARTFPALGPATIEYSWSGRMAYALNKMPLIGKDPEGVWYATGFGGHGLNTTAMAGIVIARAIGEDDDMYRRFGVLAPRWAGGPLGQIGVQASYWWMQAKDWRDELLKR